MGLLDGLWVGLFPEEAADSSPPQAIANNERQNKRLNGAQGCGVEDSFCGRSRFHHRGTFLFLREEIKALKPMRVRIGFIFSFLSIAILQERFFASIKNQKDISKKRLVD
jgi:hypothetical protein